MTTNPSKEERTARWRELDADLKKRAVSNPHYQGEKKADYYQSMIEALWTCGPEQWQLTNPHLAQWCAWQAADAMRADYSRHARREEGLHDGVMARGDSTRADKRKRARRNGDETLAWDDLTSLSRTDWQAVYNNLADRGKCNAGTAEVLELELWRRGQLHGVRHEQIARAVLCGFPINEITKHSVDGQKVSRSEAEKAQAWLERIGVKEGA